MVHAGRITVFKKTDGQLSKIGDNATTIYSDTNNWTTVITDSNPTYELLSEMFTYNKLKPWDTSKSDEISYRTTITCKECSENKTLSHGNTGYDNNDMNMSWTCTCTKTSICVIMEFRSATGRLADNAGELAKIAGTILSAVV